MTAYADTPLDAIAMALVRRADLWKHDLEIRWTRHGWTVKILDGISKDQDAAPDSADMREV